MSTAPVIVYAFDPLCGWCYGFGPQLAELRRRLGPAVSWRLACGGLVVGDRERPIREMRDYLLSGMRAVEARCGVRFGEAFVDGLLAQGDWVSRSEPACRAILLVQQRRPDLAVDFAERLCRALYFDGLPPDQSATHLKVARDLCLDGDILDDWDQMAAVARTQAAFQEARRQGIASYPSLFLELDGRLTLLCSGFAPAEEVLSELRRIAGPAIALDG